MTTSRSRRWAPAGAALLVLAVVAALVCTALAGDHVVSVDQGRIQRYLDESFPIQKSYLGVLTVTLSHPRVRLRAGSDRVGLSVTADAAVLGGAWHASGTGALSGRVRFAPGTRDLFLDAPAVDALSIRGVPSEYADPLKGAADMATQAYFASHPLYRLDRPVFSSPLGPVVVKAVTVGDGVLRVTLGRGR